MNDATRRGTSRRRLWSAVPASTVILIGAAVLAVSPAADAAGKTKAASKITKTAVDPNAPEVLSPGDIPDNIAFVPYRPAGGGFTVTTPEGWSQKTIPTGVEFTDKYNIIRIESLHTRTAPTVASVRSEVTANYGKSKGFTLQKVSTVTRKAGRAVLASYVVNSAPNEVTGKTIPVAVERYEFNRNSTSVVLTLSGAKGADNVDPWKIVTESCAGAETPNSSIGTEPKQPHA